MSCHYPSCMMGGGCCPYQEECDNEREELFRKKEEKRLLDIEEQKARIAYYKANTPSEKKAEGKS